jgi:two-component system, chemotaxis family, chemotaxis protein CheY
MKALIVDDSSSMRLILSKILKEMGFDEIYQAADGVEAVTASIEPDLKLVLMDWNMPNKSGIEALQEIRAAGHKVPIIMVTTEAEKSRVLEAIKAGANNYIIKPFSTEIVNEKIRAVLPV